MNNKVGILTFHRSTNFGSCLQTYALYKKVSDLGYSCDILDYRCPEIEKRENLTKPVISFKSPKSIYRALFQWPILKKKALELQHFSSGNMSISREYTPEDIFLSNDEYTKFISGSDIIWGRDITNFDYAYFLDFVTEDEKMFAFASSVGNYDKIGDEQKLRAIFQRYNKIAVREEEAVTWIKSISGRNAKWVCDPTMLLTEEEWKNIISPVQYNSDYVLVYFDTLNHKCLDDAIKYAKAHNKKVYYINYGRNVKGTIRKRPTSLNEFLGLIDCASKVFTASYHGMLFSIYFQKQFIFYTRAHKTRVLSLAERLGLLDYCGDTMNVLNDKYIEFTDVAKHVDDFRAESIDILKEMLDYV